MYEWQPANKDEQARGIVVWLVWFNSTIPHDIQPCPYRDHQLRRRYERGDDVPDFWLAWRSTQAWLAEPRMIDLYFEADSRQEADNVFDSAMDIQPKAIAIVGSRNYQNKQAIFDYVQTLPPNTTIVSGGARGVDTWAEEAAKARGLDTLIFKADWDKYGRSAGFRRNPDIVNACDELVAWWCKNPETGKYSKGTKNSIDKAISLGKPVRIFIPKGSEANELPRIYLEYMEAA